MNEPPFEYQNSEAGKQVGVFLHGLMGTSALMADLARWWRSRYGPTLTIDLPCHGASFFIGRPDIALAARNVVRALEKCDITNPVMCGHSMGALVGLSASGLLKGKLTAQVFLDPAPIIFDDQTRQAWIGLRTLFDSDPAAALEIIVSSQASEFDEPSKAKFRNEIFSQLTTDALISYFDSMLAFDGRSALERSNVPTLGIWANRNNEPDLISEILDDVLIGKVIGSGHYIHIEARDQVCAMIDRAMAIWCKEAVEQGLAPA